MKKEFDVKGFIFFVVLILSSLSSAEELTKYIDLVNNQTESVHQLVFDPQMIPEYRRLAAAIGYNYETEYSYRKFADISDQNAVGEAGDYESLLYSTGGNLREETPEELARRLAASYRWEMTYYKNLDLTAIELTYSRGEETYARWLKLAKGRVPELHQQ